MKLKPSIFGLMCNELVVAPCIDLFASYRHHQLPRYYSAYADDSTALGQNAFAYVWDPGVCLYVNPPWTLIGKVLTKIAEDGSRMLLVTPHWREAPWYGLLLELTVRSYEWRGRLYLTDGENLRPIPKWFTLFSYVVGKRRALTEAEMAEELAGEPWVKGERVWRLCGFVYFQVRRLKEQGCETGTTRGDFGGVCDREG